MSLKRLNPYIIINSLDIKGHGNELLDIGDCTGFFKWDRKRGGWMMNHHGPLSHDWEREGFTN